MKPVSSIQLIFAILAFCFVCGTSHGQLKRGLFIGNETYDEDQLTLLKYAEDDARELSAEFKSLGFATTTMVSDASNGRLRPTSPKKILNQLDEALKNLGKNDTFVLGLSGHGVNFKEEKPLKNGVKETYFCPSDADLNDLETLLPLSKLLNTIEKSKCGRKLVLIDCCRNELSITPKDGDKGTAKKKDLGAVYENNRIVPRGMDVIFSCSSTERSWEFGDLGKGHGVFSYFVLEYLKGKAPSNLYPQGKLSIDSLVLHARQKTSQYVFNNKSRSQTPRRRGDGNDWPLGRILFDDFTNSIGMKFKRIKAGKFLMGSPESEKGNDDDEYQHEVELTTDFHLGVYEVSQKEWIDVMGTKPWKGEKYVKEGNDVAASYISWDDAQAFCKKLSEKEGRTYRLPTEAEWEFACRGGTKTTYSFGNNESKLEDYGWFGGLFGDGNAKNEKYAHSVGQKKPNSFGLYDMHGNVWEWCEDLYDEDFYKTSPKQDPLNGTAGSSRVLRGGGWDYFASLCRSAGRDGFAPSDRDGSLGFRLVLVR